MQTISKALALALVLTTSAAAQELRQQVEAHVEQSQKAIVSELWEALGLKAVARDLESSGRKAEYLAERFRARSFTVELLPTDGNPLVWAERTVPGAERTFLLYAHYDGQPVDPSRWEQDDPFRPVLRSGKLGEGARELDFDAESRFEDDWRIYARSASDDTAPIVAILAAVDALAAAGVAPSVNVRVILDGEEEAGSPNLVPAIGRYRDKLEADLMLILDGPLHPVGRPTVMYGARGNLGVELTVYGPKFPLHSGHYGNWAPNPAIRLAQLLASMKDDEGRVVIDGFYDGITIDAETRAVLDSVPDDLEGLKELFGFSAPDQVGRSLQEAIQYPSLNVRGLRSAWVGAEARTIVPDVAIAAIDIRLVKETTADAMFDKLLRHIRGQGYHVVEEPPDDSVRAAHPRIVRVDRRGAGTNAFRTDLDDPEAQRVVEALTEMWSDAPLRVRTMGGTVPISPFVQALGFPALAVPTVNFDNNQHSPNENLRLGHFFDSIVTLAAILTAR